MTIRSSKPRSALADRLLPVSGLFRHAAPPSRRAARERIALQIAALPILVPHPAASLPEIITNVGLVGLFLTAVWVLGEGLRAEDDWRARRAARRPRLQLKMASAGLMGMAVGLAFASAGNGGGTSIAAGALGLLLHLVAFGIDPLRDKHDVEACAQDADRIEDLAARANVSLAQMLRALDRSGAPDVVAEGARLDAAAAALLSALAAAPAALPSTRRALTVWLPALAEAATRFSALHLAAPDPVRATEVAAVIAQVRGNLERLTVETQYRADLHLQRDLVVLAETAG